MKKLLMSAAFLALLASPALAQSFDPDIGTGNVNTPAYRSATVNNARAEALPTDHLAPNGSVKVYENGRYLGQDPDANVRLQLRRDAGEY